MSPWYRLANEGAEELVIVEVQHAAYTGEDDIVRLHDYGRSASA
jgi:mannose-6-phosphate isomerase-like protein (cupin superfamily)